VDPYLTWTVPVCADMGLPVSIPAYIDLEMSRVAEPSSGMMLVSTNLSLSSQPHHVVGCVLLTLVIHHKVWKIHIMWSPVSPMAPWANGIRAFTLKSTIPTDHGYPFIGNLYHLQSSRREIPQELVLVHLSFTMSSVGYLWSPFLSGTHPVTQRKEDDGEVC
jgi:hypothetical protein